MVRRSARRRSLDSEEHILKYPIDIDVVMATECCLVRLNYGRFLLSDGRGARGSGDEIVSVESSRRGAVDGQGRMARELSPSTKREGGSVSIPGGVCVCGPYASVR